MADRSLSDKRQLRCQGKCPSALIPHTARSPRALDVAIRPLKVGRHDHHHGGGLATVSLAHLAVGRMIGANPTD